jgi:hypothetical protein
MTIAPLLNFVDDVDPVIYASEVFGDIAFQPGMGG